MMKVLQFLLVIFLFGCPGHAQQHMTVVAQEPEVRLNEYIYLHFDLNFINPFFEIRIDSTKNSEIFGGSTSFLSIKPAKTGLQTFGPFSIEVNGVQYVSDTIFVNVVDSLPYVEGAWLRVFQDPVKKQTILVFEQIKRFPVQHVDTVIKGLETITTKCDFRKSDFSDIVKSPFSGTVIQPWLSTQKALSNYDLYTDSAFVLDKKSYIIRDEFRKYPIISDSLFDIKPKNLSVYVNGSRQILDRKFSAPQINNRNDTSYYSNGAIKNITTYPNYTVDSIGLCESIMIKTIFQYDECGNLRNVTVIKQTGYPCMNGILGPRYIFTDYPQTNVNCDIPWSRPLIKYKTGNQKE